MLVVQTDARRCSNSLKPLKQVFSLGKEPKTTKLTKSKPYSHVLSCLALFNDLLWRGICTKGSRSLHNYYYLYLRRPFLSFLIELYTPLRSVPLI